MRSILVALLVLLSAGPARAEIVSQYLDDLGSRGLKINAVSLESTRYTGWFNVETLPSAVLEIDWNDVDGNVSEIEMVCYTARAASGSNGSGYEIVVATTTAATGETTFKPHKWSWGFSDGDTEWEWVVSSPRAKWINCAFTAGTGTSQSGDQLTVFVRGGTP